MVEKEYFTRSVYVDITAATIGINKDDWYCFKPGMQRQEVINTMLDKKFDVVPILNKRGVFNSYFTLNKLDNTKLDVNNIEHEDRLYYLTHIKDAVWKMKKLKKPHFFLSNGHDENDIIGLLSLSNFNSREFYVYLFSILSFIERELAALIKTDKTKGFIILENRSHTEELKKQLKEIQDRYKKDVRSDNENDYKEYLYLHHLIWLLIEEEQFIKLDYKNSQDFESGTGTLKTLRNNIAHPVKSLVRNLTDLSNLEMGMNKLFEFKERIDKLSKVETD
jgi:hypothetical protein